MVCLSSWQEKTIAGWKTRKNNPQVTKIHREGATLLPCQHVLQLPPETEGKEVLQKSSEEEMIPFAK